MHRVAVADVAAVAAGLNAARIDVYFFDSDAVPFDDTLDDGERDRCARFVTARLRDRFRVCHAGKRAILAHYLQREPSSLAFVAGPFDKPRVRHGELEFNLSHSANWVVLAVAMEEVGVDCERIDDTVDYHALLGAVAHPSERVGDRHAFYRTWTRKEAAMKQVGLGFQLAPARVQVPEPDAPLPDWQRARFDVAGGTDSTPHDAPFIIDVPAPPGYCAALAAREPRDVRVFQLCAAHASTGDVA